MNQLWCNTIIEELISQGVQDFCLAPGSRSTPLTIAAEANSQANTVIHFDERGLGFFALGIAKAKKMPVAVIVTSGTAVGNLLPALMEAHHTQTPLILLTADRPFELRDCGANQATNQTFMFSQWVSWQSEFACPSDQIDIGVIRAKISFGVSQAKVKGPIHFNLPFREPLFEQVEAPTFPSLTKKSIFPELTLSMPDCHQIKETLSKYERKVILIGNQISETQAKAIAMFAEENQIPVISDIFSKPFAKNLIHHHEWMEKPHADCIIHFGSPLVSKKILSWIQNSRPQKYLQVSSNLKHIDPTHMVTDRVYCDPVNFCESLGSLPMHISAKAWLDKWFHLNTEIDQQLAKFFSEQAELTEPAFFHRMQSFMPDSKALLVGNSMPIRDASLFCPTAALPRKIFANRGLSGIDGNIATAYGIAYGLETSINAILGDLTFLADLNSLALSKQTKYPVQFIVFNNSGGSIFHHLPVSKSVHFEKCFLTKHSYDFQHIAAQFDIPYFRVNTFEDLSTNFPKSSLIELSTCAKKNSSIHEQLKEIFLYASQS